MTKKNRNPNKKIRNGTTISIPLTPLRPGSELGFRHSGANWKTPAICNFQVAFSLTPASLGQRENQEPHFDNSKLLELENALLPPPEREGRGEGEHGVRILERCDFCNHPADFGSLTQLVLHGYR